MNRSIFAVTLFSLLSSFGAQNTPKPRLRTLVMYPFTGQGPNEYKICRAMSQLVINLVNNRSDILADYFVEPQFMDDNYGVMVARRFLEFDSQFDKHNKIGNNTYKSLVMAGSIFGCENVASFMHLYGYVFVSSCTSEKMTNRQRYPNIYTIRPTGGQSWIARLKFITDVGRWQYFALLMGANQDPSASIQTYHGAAKVGVQVYIDIVSDFDDEAMIALKKSDSRIFVLSVNNQMVFRFLCQAYVYGLTGPRYVIILPGSSFADPQGLPAQPYPGCRKEIVAIQYKYAIMVTSQVIVDDPDQRSALGYTLSEMDRMLDNFTKKMRHPDYSLRHVCHDKMLQALLILDAADRSLKKEGLSLLNVTDRLDAVAKAINESAIDLEYVGLRQNGSSRYNENGEPTFNKWPMAQWTNETGLKNVHVAVQKANGSKFDPYAYFVTKSGQGVTWYSPKGEAPRDRAKLQELKKEVETSVKISVYFFAGVLSVFNILAITGAFYKQSEVHKCMPLSLSACQFGLILVNISAVLWVLTVSDALMPRLYQARVVTLIIGLVIANFSMANQIFALFVSVDRVNHGKSPCGGVAVPNSAELLRVSGRVSTRRSVNSVTSRNPTNRPSEKAINESYSKIYDKTVFEKLDRYSVVFTIGCAILLCGAYVVVWSLAEPIMCRNVELTPIPIYLETDDTFVRTTLTSCYTENEVPWMLSMAAANVALLIAGCYCGRGLTRNARFMTNVRFVVSGMMNVVGMISATILILLALPNPVTRRIVIASSALLISALTALLNILPLTGKRH